eukprot:2598813-Pleurochrysis_carterae.AAC.1
MPQGSLTHALLLCPGLMLRDPMADHATSDQSSSCGSRRGALRLPSLRVARQRCLRRQPPRGAAALAASARARARGPLRGPGAPVHTDQVVRCERTSR